MNGFISHLLKILPLLFSTSRRGEGRLPRGHREQPGRAEGWAFQGVLIFLQPQVGNIDAQDGAAGKWGRGQGLSLQAESLELCPRNPGEPWRVLSRGGLGLALRRFPDLAWETEARTPGGGDAGTQVSEAGAGTRERRMAR